MKAQHQHLDVELDRMTIPCNGKNRQKKKHERIQQCHRDRTSQATSQIGALMKNSTCERLQGCIYQILYNLRFVYWLLRCCYYYSCRSFLFVLYDVKQLFLN